MVSFAPGEREQAVIYGLMTTVIAPRPIAFVATVSRDGRRNLAPFSFFNMITATPPMLAISVGSRAGRPKDTARNILETGEFVVHVVDEALLPAMNVASADFEPEVDEFRASGLTPTEATIVRAPRVAEARVAMECRLAHVLTLGTPARRTYHVIGEIVQFHVAEEAPGALAGGRPVQPVGRLGRGQYVRTEDRLLLPAPTLAEDGQSAISAHPRTVPAVSP